jgi:hypothetical protein
MVVMVAVVTLRRMSNVAALIRCLVVHMSLSFRGAVAKRR